MSEYNQMIGEILKSVHLMSDRKISSSNITSVGIAEISSELEKTTNEYQVIYNGSSYLAYSLKGENFSIGEKVLILLSNGKLDNKILILSRAVQEAEENTSPNILTEEELIEIKDKIEALSGEVSEKTKTFKNTPEDGPFPQSPGDTWFSTDGSSYLAKRIEDIQDIDYIIDYQKKEISAISTTFLGYSINSFSFNAGVGTIYIGSNSSPDKQVFSVGDEITIAETSIEDLDGVYIVSAIRTNEIDFAISTEITETVSQGICYKTDSGIYLAKATLYPDSTGVGAGRAIINGETESSHRGIVDIIRTEGNLAVWKTDNPEILENLDITTEDLNFYYNVSIETFVSVDSIDKDITDIPDENDYVAISGLLVPVPFNGVWKVFRKGNQGTSFEVVQDNPILNNGSGSGYAPDEIYYGVELIPIGGTSIINPVADIAINSEGKISEVFMKSYGYGAAANDIFKVSIDGNETGRVRVSESDFFFSYLLSLNSIPILPDINNDGMPDVIMDRPKLLDPDTISVFGWDNLDFGISGILSNETYITSTANDGTGYNLDNAGGVFSIFSGTADVTTSSVFSVNGSTSQTLNGLTLTIGASTGVYSLSGAWTSDSEVFELTAVYNGATINKKYKISKAKTGNTGANGINAKTVSATINNQVFTYTSSGTNPSPTNATITASAQNISGTPYYEFLVGGVSKQNSTASSYVYTPQSQSSNMPEYIEVRVRENSTTGSVVAYDTISIIGVKPGANGTNGVNGLSAFLTNEAHVTSALADGTGYSLTSAGGTFKVYGGVTDVTASSVFSVNGSTSQTLNGLTLTIGASTGIYSLSGDSNSWTSDSESFTLSATYSGTTINKIYKISKSKVGATGANGADGKTYSVTITGGNRSFNYDGSGSNPSPSPTAFSVSLYENSTSVTPSSYSWSSGGAFSGTETSSTFTPTISSSFSNVYTYVTVTVGYAGFSFTQTIPITLSKNGVDQNLLGWVSDWDNNKTTVGTESIVTPKIFAGQGGASPTGISIGRAIANGGAQATTAGIAGYKSGTQTFLLDTDGNLTIGAGSSKLTYDSTTGLLAIPAANVTGVLSAATIDAGNITTGTFSADRISGGTLIVGGEVNQDGIINIKDIYGDLTGIIDSNGIKTGPLSTNDGYYTQESVLKKDAFYTHRKWADDGINPTTLYSGELTDSQVQISETNNGNVNYYRQGRLNQYSLAISREDASGVHFSYLDKQSLKIKANDTSAIFSLIQVSGTNGTEGAGASNGAYTDTLGNALALLAVGESSPLQLGTNGAVRLTIDTAGNVGIGTTAPDAAFHVVGHIRTDSQFISTVATGTPPLSVISSTLVPSLNADRVDGYHASAFVIKAGDTMTDNLTLAKASGDVRLTLDNTTATTGKAYGILSTSGGQLRFRDVDTTSDRMVIDSSGNVGIGTTTPSNKLHVNSGAVDTVALFESTDQYATIKFKDGLSASTGGAEIGADTDSLYIRTGSTLARAVTVDSSGYVGIGTAAPGTALDVVGNIRTNSRLISTVTTGAPLLVSSSTVVQSLNADQVDGKDATDFLFAPTSIPNGADLNDYVTAGMYYCNTNGSSTTTPPTGARSILNNPFSVAISANMLAFSLLVEKHAGVKQTLSFYSTNDYRTWIRNYYNGSWGPWVSLLETNGRVNSDLLDGLNSTQFLRSDTNDTKTGNLYLNNTADVSLTSTTHALTIGDNAGANLAFDTNEIMARNNGVVANLYLNNQGGAVYMFNATGNEIVFNQSGTISFANNAVGANYSNGPGSTAYNRTATGSGWYAVWMNSALQFMRNTSSLRYKENVRQLVDIIPTIANDMLKLEPVIFDRKDNDAQKNEVGFIAEQVYEHFPEAVSLDEDGIVDGIYDRQLISGLLALCQQQQREINQLRIDVNKLMEAK